MKLTKEYKDAWAYIGGLSEPSKMPWYSYSLPASRCKIGSVLAILGDTTCHDCYALKHWYASSHVQKCLERRYQALVTNTDRWYNAMITVLTHKSQNRPQYFRWHDSGDLQGVWHLQAIVNIAEALPHIQFWLPTREYSMVAEYRLHGHIPSNLTIRLSAHKTNTNWQVKSLPTSTVFTEQWKGQGQLCHANSQGHKCLDCRACWDKSIQNIVYQQH